MYEIYKNDELLYKPNEREMVLSSARLSLEINNAGSFMFVMPASHPMYNELEKFKTVITVMSDNQIIFKGRIIEESLDIFKNKTIYCEGELAILNDSIQRPSENHDITVRQFLEFLINNHNSQVEESKQFVVGSVTVTDSNDSLYRYTNYENTLTAIKEKLIDKLGGYIMLRYSEGQRIIDYVAEMPDTCTQTIKFGENLLDYSSNINVSDIATRLIPLGSKLEESEYTAIDQRVTIESVNDGKDYIQSDEAIERYGIITKINTWDDVNVPSILLQKAQNYLESIQWENMILDVTAVDMHQLNPDIEEIHIGDKILCISDVHGLRKYFPVHKMDIDLLNPANNKIQLGTKEDISITTKTNITSDLAEEASDFPLSSILQSAKDNASSLIKMATNGFIVLHMNENGSPDELLIMDTADIETATKVWRWNVNGLGYSNTGYNGNYGLAMTMDGAIVADKITTGSLDASKVNVTNLNATNITTGTLKGISIESNNAKITGGSVNINSNTDQNDLIRLTYGSNSTRIYPALVQTGADSGKKSRMNANGVYVNNSSNEIASSMTDSYVSAPAFYIYQGSGYGMLGGATGSFVDRNGKTVNVTGGIITKL